MNTLTITISWLPESALDALEDHFEELNDEHLIEDQTQLHTLRSLIMGYRAAWDEIEKRQSKEHLLNIAVEALKKVQLGVYDCDVPPVVEEALKQIQVNQSDKSTEGDPYEQGFKSNH
ncbi:hypothetical protein [Paenibacillus qinlingensis]|uniref:hypothetical protein n=1 Tax=Paenibacillus qinlingensis TaxID=1837343 RepID=UPI00156483D1|nr:hypothetical protein [Paenibacillus qinlingensis]NQX57524.1 hypothetical protein [Paenibacillus qinlingensis]